MKIIAAVFEVCLIDKETLNVVIMISLSKSMSFADDTC